MEVFVILWNCSEFFQTTRFMEEEIANALNLTIPWPSQNGIFIMDSSATNKNTLKDIIDFAVERQPTPGDCWTIFNR